LLAAVPRGFAVLSGDDPTACSAVLVGAHGVVSVTANIVPAAVAAVMAAALRGNGELAARLDADLQPLHQSLALEPNPIPIKWAMAEAKLIGSGIRLPLTWLSGGAQLSVRSALRTAIAASEVTRARSA